MFTVQKVMKSEKKEFTKKKQTTISNLKQAKFRTSEAFSNANACLVASPDHASYL